MTGHVTSWHYTWSHKAEINRLNTFSEFLSFVHVTLHVTRLLPFTLSIPPRATVRAVGTGFEVDPFRILKALYPTGQSACSGEAGQSLETVEHFETVVEHLETVVEHLKTVEHLETIVEHLETSTSRPSNTSRSLRRSRSSGTPKPPSTLALRIILQPPSMLRPTSTSGPPFTLSPPTPSKLLGRRANNAHVSALLLPSRRMSHWRPADWPLEGTSHLDHSQSTLLGFWYWSSRWGPGRTSW